MFRKPQESVIILTALYFIMCKQAKTLENQVGVKKVKSRGAFEGNSIYAQLLREKNQMFY